MRITENEGEGMVGFALQEMCFFLFLFLFQVEVRCYWLSLETSYVKVY